MRAMRVCTPYYVANDARLEAGDLVLVDAGAEVQGYTADVTRTFPCGGRFAPEQRRVYDLVLRAQEEAIRLTRPGATIDGLHARVSPLHVMVETRSRTGADTGEPPRRDPAAPDARNY